MKELGNVGALMVNLSDDQTALVFESMAKGPVSAVVRSEGHKIGRLTLSKMGNRGEVKLTEAAKPITRVVVALQAKGKRPKKALPSAAFNVA